jgi:hypothetical protein
MHRKFLMLLVVLATAVALGGVNSASGQASVERLPLMWHAQSGKVGEVGSGAYAVLTRTDGGIHYRVQATDLIPGHAYTLWIAVIPNPSVCSVLPCPPPEALGNPDSKIQVKLAGGAVARSGGMVSISGRIDADDVPANGWYDGRAFENVLDAEVHLVFNDHGPALEAYMPDMTSSYRGGCTDESLVPIFPDSAKADGAPGPNTCRLYQVVIFTP